MPFYDYKCSGCGHSIKDFKKPISDPHPTSCPVCNEETLTQSYEDYDSIVQYKGKGWFKTDGKY